MPFWHQRIFPVNTDSSSCPFLCGIFFLWTLHAYPWRSFPFARAISIFAIPFPDIRRNRNHYCSLQLATYLAYGSLPYTGAAFRVYVFVSSWLNRLWLIPKNMHFSLHTFIIGKADIRIRIWTWPGRWIWSPFPGNQSDFSVAQENIQRYAIKYNNFSSCHACVPFLLPWSSLSFITLFTRFILLPLYCSW